MSNANKKQSEVLADQQIANEEKTKRELKNFASIEDYHKQRKDALKREIKSYLEQGYSVLPIKPQEKIPFIKWKHLQQGQPSKKDALKWVDKFDDMNLGLVTGYANDLIVIDVDGAKGFDVLKGLGIAYEQHPHVKTAKGIHVYFTCKTKLPNKAGVLTELDIRSHGGYITVPPSKHASGHRYAWGNDLRPKDAMPLPQSIINIFKEGKSKMTTPNLSINHPYVQAVINNNLDTLCGTLKGARNDALNQCSFTIGRLIPSLIDADENELKAEINKIALQIGLGKDEIDQTMNTAFQAGMDNPMNLDHIVEKQTAKTAKTSKANKESVIDLHEQSLEWEPVVPLGNELPDVPTLSLDETNEMLPKAIADWIIDGAERLSVPYEFMAGPSLVVLSAAIGARLRVYPKQNDKSWRQTPNLWGVNIASPSAKKSPVQAAAVKPLKMIEDGWIEDFSNKSDERKLDLKVINADIQSLRRKISSDKHTANREQLRKDYLKLEKQKAFLESQKPKRAIVNDATVEMLGELMNKNDNGLLLVEDEMSRLLQSFEKKGHETDRYFFLSAWNGDGSYSVDRIMRGSLHIKQTVLSIIGNIQPDVMSTFTAKYLQTSNDGFLQRFQLAIWPDIHFKEGLVDRPINEDALNRVCELVKSIIDEVPNQILELKSGEGVNLDADAQKLFDAWYSRNKKLAENFKNEECTALEAHVSKYPSLVSSLALIFWVIDLLDGVAEGSEINVVNMQRAIQWCEFLTQHALRLFRHQVDPARAAAFVIAEKIDSRVLTSRASVRDVNRAKWSGLTDSAITKKGLQYLEDRNWIKVEKIVEQERSDKDADGLEDDHNDKKGGGRPKYLIFINPELQ